MAEMEALGSYLDDAVIPVTPEVHAALTRGAYVADIACGRGGILENNEVYPMA